MDALVPSDDARKNILPLGTPIRDLVVPAAFTSCCLHGPPQQTCGRAPKFATRRNLIVKCCFQRIYTRACSRHVGPRVARTFVSSDWQLEHTQLLPTSTLPDRGVCASNSNRRQHQGCCGRLWNLDIDEIEKSRGVVPISIRASTDNLHRYHSGNQPCHSFRLREPHLAIER